MKLEWNDNKAFELLRQQTTDRMTVAINQVKNSAVALCPVDLGLLRDSIIDEVIIDANGLDIIGRVGTPVEYAPYVEFGTGEYAENGQGRKGGWFYANDKEVVGGIRALGKTKDGKFLHFTYGSYPQPYLRPALIENKETIKKIFNIV